MSTTNYYTREGALKLKEWIERYWNNRGYDVKVDLIEASFHNGIRAARFDVRSDLVNGMPRHKPTPSVRRPRSMETMK